MITYTQAANKNNKNKRNLNLVIKEPNARVHPLNSPSA